MTILDQAKANLDKELDQAVADGLKMWQRHLDKHELKEMDISDESAMLAFMLPNIIDNSKNTFDNPSHVTGADQHITVKYFPELTAENESKLRAGLADYNPIDADFDGSAKIVDVMKFEGVNDGKEDAVVLKIQPTKLRKFRNHLLGFLEDYGVDIPQDTYPSYNPHITLAYVPLGSDYTVTTKSGDLDLGKLSLVRQDDEIKTINLKEYLVEKQLPIDDHSKKVLLQARINIFNDESDDLAERLFNGDISIGQWQDEMKALVKGLNTSAAAIGKGGWDLMGPRDWGRLGTPNREQYKFLKGFAQDISDNRETISLAYLKNRQRLYGESAANVATEAEAGFWWKDNLPWLPRDGTTACLVRCHCKWELSTIETRKSFNMVEAIWRLGEADHCDDCIGRDGHREIIKTPLDVDVPTQIGGY